MTSSSRPARSGASHALVSAWTAPRNPRSSPETSLRGHDASGSAWTRTKWRAAARKSKSVGIPKTCAWRSAKSRLQSGYSLIVSLMTLDVAQK
jgi:hypothetical protein